MKTLIMSCFIVFIRFKNGNDAGGLFLICALTLAKCWGQTQDQFFQGRKSLALTSTYKTIPSPSEIHCCLTCARDPFCASVNYRKSSNECQLSYVPLAAAMTYQTPDVTSMMYILKDWTLVLRATPGIGIEVKDAWTTGNNVTTDDVTCTELSVTSCSKHYRHPLVKGWKNMDISKVKLAFYKGSLEKYMVFNGSGSDLTSWFNKPRVLESSWSKLLTHGFAFFSLEGDFTRHFYSSMPYAHCSTDKIFTLVVDSRTDWACQFDKKHSSYPQFLFASGADYGYPESMQGGGAGGRPRDIYPIKLPSAKCNESVLGTLGLIHLRKV